jgi:hypothetical protein
MVVWIDIHKGYVGWIGFGRARARGRGGLGEGGLIYCYRKDIGLELVVDR